LFWSPRLIEDCETLLHSRELLLVLLLIVLLFR
jgi:hypothetical protein